MDGAALDRGDRFLGLLFVVFAGNRVGPPSAGSIAGLVLASSCAYFLSSQYLTHGHGLTFFMSGALLAFLLAHEGGPPVKRGWMLLAWGAMACAVLTKGLVGIVLPGMALAVYVLVAARLAPVAGARMGPRAAAVLAPRAAVVHHRAAAQPRIFRLLRAA